MVGAARRRPKVSCCPWSQNHANPSSAASAAGFTCRLEQVERIERAGAAPIPDQGTVPGEGSARPGEVQRLLDVIARVRVLPGEKGAKSVVRADPVIAGTERGVLVADFPGPEG